MKILEIGNYIIPAYAGMILAEQGHEVIKWTNGNDPTLSLNDGDKLWSWLNQGKNIVNKNFSEIPSALDEFDAVIDNVKESSLRRLGIDPAALAAKHQVRWISMRSESEDEISFDIIAQARSWMQYADWIPFYVGDTTGGLWLAFKLLASNKPEHAVIYQASAMQKLVEGELIHTPDRNRNQIPWDNEPYEFKDGKAIVQYKNKTYEESIKNTEWKLKHLKHINGRITI